MLPAATQFPLVLQAIELIADGQTIRKACDKVKLSIATFLRLTVEVPELRDLRIEAEQRGYDALAEILLEIDTNPTYGGSDTKHQKLMSDNIKWYLERKRPAQYGNKVTVEHSITADKAIIEALQRGKQHVIDNVIEGTFREVLPEIAPPEPVYVPVDPEDDWQQFA